MMLPSVPKSLGRLSEVMLSAMASIEGIANPIQLPKASSACVILVDGLGSSNLKFRAGHAPKLSRHLEIDGSILCGFPATTATSLTSLTTGKLGGEHGVIGYEVFDRQSNAALNLLTGLTEKHLEAKYQSQPTISEVAESKGLKMHFVGSPEYENSAFTKITLPFAEYHRGKTIDDRFAIAKRILQSGSKNLIYLYISELDTKAHGFGAASVEWLELLELLESQVSKFVVESLNGAGILLTADHGIIDVSPARQIYLDDFEFDSQPLNVSGDPRVNFVYFENEPGQEEISRLRSWFKNRAYVASRAEMIASNWYGLVSEVSASRMPDLFIVARGETAIYHRRFTKPHSLKMIGQHGGMDIDELTIPLLRFGAYAKQ